MRRLNVLFLALAFAGAIPAPAHAQTEVLCMLIADAASGGVLLEEGDCRTRATPASTFKLPLAVMGYDAGILTDAANPVMKWRRGEPDWGGAKGKREIDPMQWMQLSVVWYSQRITRALGTEKLRDYARAFGYGNADFRGVPGAENGLQRAWISSSLQVSPHEQIGFVRALVRETLPVRKDAMARARALVEDHRVDGWAIRGKTGSAFPRRADRTLDYARGWGWYVGWAERGDRTLVFARLTQARARSVVSQGLATRSGLLEAWPAITGRLAPAN